MIIRFYTINDSVLYTKSKNRSDKIRIYSLPQRLLEWRKWAHTLSIQERKFFMSLLISNNPTTVITTCENIRQIQLIDTNQAVRTVLHAIKIATNDNYII